MPNVAVVAHPSLDKNPQTMDEVGHEFGKPCGGAKLSKDELARAVSSTYRRCNLLLFNVARQAKFFEQRDVTRWWQRH